MKYKLFISYSSKDKAIVKKIVSALNGLGIQLWFDEWEINVGDSIATKIREGLKESSYLLIVLSTNSVRSSWVEKELNIALMKEIESKNVVIMPALLDNCEIPEIIRDKKYADFRTSFESGISALSKTLIPKMNTVPRRSGDVIAEFLHKLAQFKNGINGPDFFEHVRSDFAFKLWDPAAPLDGYIRQEISLIERGLIQIEGRKISVSQKGKNYLEQFYSGKE